MSTATRTPGSPGTISPGRTGGRRIGLSEVLPERFMAIFAMAWAFWGSLWTGVKQWAQALVARHLNTEKSVYHNLVGASVTLGLSVIMIILMAIVAGYFVAEAPSNGAFSDAINQVEGVGGTSFILLAVALLGVPVVAIVGYFMRSGLGAFITTGGMGRRR